MRVLAPAALVPLLSACGDVVFEDNGELEAPKPPSSPGVTPQAPASCAIGELGDPSRPVLALVRGADIVFVHADGTYETVFTFEGLGGVPTEFPPQIELTARGDFVGAVGFVDWPAKMSEAVLLRRSGEIVGKGSMASDAFLGVYLSSDGWLATAVNKAASTFYIDPTGTPQMFDGLWVVGAPRPGGLTPVLLEPSSPSNAGYRWFDPATASLLPLAFATSSPRAVDDGLVYTAAENGSPLLVRDHGDSVSTAPLPGPHGVSFAPPGGWVMLTPNWFDFLLAPPGGAAPIPVALPAELWPIGGFIDSWYDGPGVDGLGNALLVSRDDYRAGLYRSGDGGSSWELIGEGFEGVAEIVYVARGGTYVTIAMGTDGDETWSDPPTAERAAGHVGPGVELARPVDAIVRTLAADASDFVLDDSGACLAYVRDGAWTATDVGSAAAIDLPTIVDGQTPRAVWLTE